MTTPWKSVRKELKGEIMKTDVVVEVLCRSSEDEFEASWRIEQAVDMLRDFEARFSRFVRGNELWRFNMSDGGQISEELFDILQRAKHYHRMTEGVFNPGVLSSLESLGYEGVYGDLSSEDDIENDFSKIRVESVEKRIVRKPENLRIDLGGIGKGYIVDHVADFLHARFENVLVDAGGDIAVRGVNAKEGYDFWAIDVEHPTRREESAELLMLSNCAVATSGRNRKQWTRENGESAHHLVDPASGQSASEALLSVTVVAENATEADVFAKTLFITGKERGLGVAESLGIPALFVDSLGAKTANHAMDRYVWKETNVIPSMSFRT